MTTDQKSDVGRQPPEPRPDSPVYGSPRLKEVILDAALNGSLTQQDVDDLFVEYGLVSA